MSDPKIFPILCDFKIIWNNDKMIFSSPGQSPGRAIVLPLASALALVWALALVAASGLANVKVLR